MNGSPVLSFAFFKSITHLILEPNRSAKSLKFLALNGLSLGLYGSVKAFAKAHRVKELKQMQADLKQQIKDLSRQWNALEVTLNAKLQHSHTLDKANLQRLKTEFERLLKQNVQSDQQPVPYVSPLAWKMISFAGQMLANVLTAGIYAAYRHRVYKSKIKHLKANCAQLKKQFETDLVFKSHQCQILLNRAEQNIQAQEDMMILASTDPRLICQEVLKVRRQREELRKKQEELARDLIDARLKLEQTQQIAKTEAQEAQRKLTRLIEDNQRLKSCELHIREQSAKWEKAYHTVHKELGSLKVKASKEITGLQKDLREFRAKAEQVKELEKQVMQLKTALDTHSQIAQLATQLGPLPSKYKRRAQDGLLNGAMDIAEGQQVVDHQVHAAAVAYNLRYGDKPTAAEIMKEGFIYAWHTLLDMTLEGKIKINDSEETFYSPGAQAVYRLIILDLLEGAKVVEEGCNGMILQINPQVVMRPSCPTKVLTYAFDASTLDFTRPEVITHYHLRDDFTPSEKIIGPNGVDPVSAKWILEQLSHAEKSILFTLLMDPVIENTHPDYMKMREVMRNLHHPQVQLIQTAYELIQDLAVAIDKKFAESVFIPLWKKYAANPDKAPFIKTEDIYPIAEREHISKEKPLVNWELDLDVLGDKRPFEPFSRQPHFAEAIIEAQIRYKTALDYMSYDLLLRPAPIEKEFSRLTWEELNSCYYISHKMLGADRQFRGGQLCLFSNLLAILVAHEKELTVANVLALKRAMAAYLDKLQDAEMKWNAMQNKTSSEAKRLKRLAKLAKKFEQQIKNTHQCDLPSYQAWLRAQIGAARIDAQHLTPLEVELGAYTVGIRIGLLGVNVKLEGKEVNYPARVDQWGRVIPNEDFYFYGPNTKEVLLMAYSNDSYYGLFPRLNLLQNKKLKAAMTNDEEYHLLLDLEQYWTAIDYRSKK